MEAKPPRMLGPYQVLKEIGRGSFGSVYLGDDTVLGRKVALKVPHPEVLNNPHHRERFLTEARAVARLQHRCIVVVYQVEAEGRYIATEYLTGRTLREELERGPLDIERALWIAAELADALAHAHTAGIIHRDIKPSNVILTEKGEVKLIDFGLARIDVSTVTADNAVLGTLIYMSPEQVAGETRKVREPSDQFNLGAVLYEMLCGTPPYGREGRMIALRISQKPPRPRTINPAISPELEAVVMRTLERVPADRYPTCRALAEDLRRLGKPHLLGLDRAEAAPALQPSRPPELGFDSSRFVDVPGSAFEPGSVFEAGSLISPSLDLARPGQDALDPPALLRYRPILADLQVAVTERAMAEERVTTQSDRDTAQLERKARKRREAEDARYAQARAEVLDESSRRAESAREYLQLGLEGAEQGHRDATLKVQNKARSLIADAEERTEWAAVQADALLQHRLAEANARMKVWRDAVAAIRRQAEQAQARLGELAEQAAGRGAEPTPPPPPPTEATEGRTSARRLRGRIEATRAEVDALGSAGGGAVGLLLNRFQSRARAGRLAEGSARLAGEVAHLLATLDAHQGRIEAAFLRRQERMKAAHDRSLRDDRARLAEFIANAESRRATMLAKADAMLADARTRLQAEYGAAQDPSGKLAELDRAHDQARAAIEAERLKQERAVRARRQNDFAELAVRWRAGMDAVRADLAAIAAAVAPSNPAWGDPAWDDWTPPTEVNPLIRFGTVRVALDRLPHGLPEDARLMEGLPAELDWPALLRLHGRASLLIEGPEASLGAASAVLQATATRLVAAVPAGQVRLTVVDPVGLGGDFGPFLQLADFEESLATLRTDQPGIEQGLADLAGHIRKMFRSYFRADVRSIYEYNRVAAEAAEPIRVLIVAGFPHGFSLAACDDLARIVRRGAQCGVITLISADRKKAIPGDLSLATLARHAVHLTWKSNRFAWEDDDFGSFQLALDPPPPASLVGEVLAKVGTAAVDARRVQIPFELVAPPRDRWWQADSRAGIDVPLGRAGASKFQSMVLGRGTSQHVLVAGRTGSGKSTLLHALITNLALNYHPDALELYLIDFKKGVEFHTYAVHELPHARVIAVESEREFGISVLHRLDEELKERGERFRQAGVQDLKAYRGIPGLPCLPRVLLIVDEFQEFFVEDDQLAAEATHLLDRLVRQGRAFGIHILMGSQSLGGAFSLARATFGQMSVRIALQCSETDSRIILSEDNGAARLLSRSGEAIYNDANGLPEGNHFFQVVWQPEDVREEYLRRVRDLARERGWAPPRPPVIFEGNAASAFGKNQEVRALLAADAPSTVGGGVAAGSSFGPGRAPTAYLGEAIEIKPPTSARFRRLSGENLLIVGQDAQIARGVMAATLLSLAAHHAAHGNGARFYVLDEVEPDTDEASDLARVRAVVPQPVVRGGRAEAGAILAELAAVVARRLEAGPGEGDEVYLFVDNVAAFRMLQRPEDEFSMEARDPSLPSNALAAVLKDGASVGVHLILWADSLNNLNRTLDRQGRREFNAKVAMQMSAADSANLLDSAAAGRLGYHRAYLLDEVQGRLEKFRPYAIPPAEWTTWARARLQRGDLSPV